MLMIPIGIHGYINRQEGELTVHIPFFRSRRSVATALVALALPILLAACGGAQSASGGPGSGAAGSTEPILLGVSGPLTGDHAEYGKIWRKGFDLALEEINGKGGIKGRPLQYVFEDTQSDPKQTPAVAQKFAANDKIVAVLGDFSSPASMAASPIYQRTGIVQLGLTNSHPDFTNAGNFIFSNSSSQKDDAPALAAIAVQDLGKKRLAVLHQNTDWGKTAAQLVVDTAKQLGAEVVLQEGYLITEKDFRPVLTKTRDAKPDALVLVSYYNDASLIAQQRKAVGLDVPVVAISSNYSPQFLKLGGEAVEGIIVGTRFHPAEPRPEVQAFVKAFRAKYNEDPDSFAAIAYDGVKLLANVMEKYGVDRKAIRDGLEKEPSQTVLYGQSAFGPDRRLRNPQFVRVVVKNGKFEIWNPGN